MMADQISEEDIRKLLAEMRANSPTGGALGQVSDFDPPPLSLGNDRTTSIYDEYLNQEGLESVGADTPREYESGQPVPPMTPEELEKRRIEDEDKFERRMWKALMEPTGGSRMNGR